MSKHRIRRQGCSEDPAKLETRWPASKNNSSCPARTLHPCRNNSVLAVGWPFLGRAEIVVWSDSVIPGDMGAVGPWSRPVLSLTPHTWSTAHAGSTGSKYAPSGTWAQEHAGRTVILNPCWCLTIQLIAVGRSILPPKAAVEGALLKFLFEWVLFKAVQIQLWGKCSTLCSPFMGSVQKMHIKSCPTGACTNCTNHSSFNHYFFFSITPKYVLKMFFNLVFHNEAGTCLCSQTTAGGIKQHLMTLAPYPGTCLKLQPLKKSSPMSKRKAGTSRCSSSWSAKHLALSGKLNPHN